MEVVNLAQVVMWFPDFLENILNTFDVKTRL